MEHISRYELLELTSNSVYKDSDLKTIVTIPLFYGQEVVYTSSLAFLHQAVGVNGPLEKPDMSMLKCARFPDFLDSLSISRNFFLE